MWWTFLFYLFLLYHSGSCSCYLPYELQGVYLTQRPDQQRSGSFYDEVTVRPDEIKNLGKCISRQDNNVILEDGEESSRCLRCYRLLLRTPNVLQVYTDIDSRCHSTEFQARRSCPFDEGSQKKEMTLYKRHGFNADREVGLVPQFCPLAGYTTFTYDINDGTEDTLECDKGTSSMTDCPSGTDLEIKFRDCSFSSLSLQYKCLGDWPGPNGQRYIAFMDMDGGGGQGDKRKLFRCGMYSRDEATQQMFLAFSSDSTCQKNLRSSEQGYEAMIIKYRPALRWPRQVEEYSCTFPQWAWGKWESMDINSTAVVHKETKDFLTHTSKCVQGSTQTDKFLVYSRSACDVDGMFNCLWIKKRTKDVLEYKMGKIPSGTSLSSLCNNENFADVEWNTQGRLGVIESSCPISGEYVGSIPDGSGLGATLISDCLQRDIMYYKVRSNNTTSTRNAGTSREYSRRYDTIRSKRQTANVGASMTIKKEEPIDINPPDEEEEAPQEDPPFEFNRGYDIFAFHQERSTPEKKEDQSDDHGLSGNQGTGIDPYSFGRDQGGYDRSSQEDYERRPQETHDRRSQDTYDRRPQDEYNRRQDEYSRRPENEYDRNPQEDYNRRPQDEYERRPQDEYERRPQDRRPQDEYERRPQDRRPQDEYERMPQDRRPQNEYERRTQVDYDRRPQEEYERRAQTDYDRRPGSQDPRDPPYLDYRDNTRYSPGREVDGNPYDNTNNQPSNGGDFYYRDSDPQKIIIKEEERTYRCVGAWEENGVLYTYTQRQDIPGYECFVGVVQDDANSIQISEAGSNCKRNSRSTRMQLDKQGPCMRSTAATGTTLAPIRSTTPRRTRPTTTERVTTTRSYSRYTPPTTSTTQRPRSTPRWRPSSRRPTWRPITGRPITRGGGGGAGTNGLNIILSLLLPLTMILYHFHL